MLGLWTEFIADSHKRAAAADIANSASLIEVFCWLRWKYLTDAMWPTPADHSVGLWSKRHKYQRNTHSPDTFSQIYGRLISLMVAPSLEPQVHLPLSLHASAVQGVCQQTLTCLVSACQGDFIPLLFPLLQRGGKCLQTLYGPHCYTCMLVSSQCPRLGVKTSAVVPVSSDSGWSGNIMENTISISESMTYWSVIVVWLVKHLLLWR